MQVEFRKWKLLIMDEKSMIGLKMLNQIDQRLRPIMAYPDELFGGINLQSYSCHCFCTIVFELIRQNLVFSFI